jgi:hypothetical protein
MKKRFEISQGGQRWEVQIDEAEESHLVGLQRAINELDPPLNFQSPPFVQPEFSKHWSIVSGSFIIAEIQPKP